MRFAMIREADGSAARCECSLCGDTIYVGEDYYQINGQVLCTGCLAEFAEGYFAPYLCKGDEETWQ